jgi:hypothetical protein
MIQDRKVVNIGHEGEHNTGQEGSEYWTGGRTWYRTGRWWILDKRENMIQDRKVVNIGHKYI